VQWRIYRELRTSGWPLNLCCFLFMRPVLMSVMLLWQPFKCCNIYCIVILCYCLEKILIDRLVLASATTSATTQGKVIINSECSRNRLSTGLCPDQSGELTALPNPLTLSSPVMPNQSVQGYTGLTHHFNFLTSGHSGAQQSARMSKN